jgi:hypothetical protein
VEPRKFYLDTQRRAFIDSPDSTLASGAPLFFQEDVEQVNLYFLKPTGSVDRPYDYIDYSANTVKLAVGLTAPAALQTSWTATTTAITASITTLTNGGSGANEVQKITFAGDPPSQGGFSLTLPARNVTVSSVSAGVFTAVNHGLLNGQSATLSAFTISGSSFANSSYIVVQRTKDTFRISSTDGGTAINAQVTSGGGTATLPAITTPQIPFNGTAVDVQNALIGAGINVSGVGQIIVSGSYAQGFTFTFANTQASINFDPMTVSSTLAAPVGLHANVSFNTNEVAALIAAGTTTNLKFEVEVAGNGRRQTYQTTCSVGDDIITSNNAIPLPANTGNSINLSDGAGGVWTVTVDANGILTTAKQ